MLTFSVFQTGRNEHTIEQLQDQLDFHQSGQLIVISKSYRRTKVAKLITNTYSSLLVQSMTVIINLYGLTLKAEDKRTLA